MASNSAPVVDRIRLIPRPKDFLDRNVGASGELFYDRDSFTLRVYDSDLLGGHAVTTDTNIRQIVGEQDVASIRYTVTVTAGDSGNIYVLNSENNPTLTFIKGYTYVFDQSDSTNVYYPNPVGGELNQHPLNFSSDNINGELSGGTTFTEGVQYILDGKVVTKDRYIDRFNESLSRVVQITITSNTPETLYYYCNNHLNMGNSIDVSDPGSGSGASLTSSDTAPETPSNGSLWYNSTNGFLYVYIEDQDSSQWVQPAVPGPKTLTDLNISDGSAGQFLRTNGAGSFTFSTVTLNTIENFVFEGSTLKAEDSGTLSVGAPLSLNSLSFTAGSSANNISNDSTLTNADSSSLITEFAVKTYVDTALGGSINPTSISLPLGNTITDFSNDGNFIDNSTSAVPTENAVKTYVDNAISGIDLSTFSSAVTFENFVTFQETTEVVNKKTLATGVVDHDLSEGSVWYHSSVSGNFIVNLTNVPTTVDRTLSIAIIVDQEATPYDITAIQIDGVNVTINWQGGTGSPSTNANQYDVYSFTLFRRGAIAPFGALWIALGGLTTYA